MILRSMVLYISVGIIFLSKKPAGCNPITNSNFNEHIREFAVKEDDFNSSNAKTLQEEEPGRYANFTPIRSPVKFKDPQDSSQSSSSYSRGLVHHGYPEYPLHEYEGSHYEYGTEYHFPEYHPGYPPHGIDHHGIDHNYGHHDGHHGGHHGGHHNGHHYPDYHKYHHHGLAAKTVLWPIAGLALLGAAAALVTNPILLQIGVASGKRRRRDTEEDLEPSIDVSRWTSKESENIDKEQAKDEISKIKTRQRAHLLQKRNSFKHRRNRYKNLSPSESTNPYYDYNSYSSTPGIDNDNVYIPVPIKIKDVSSNVL